jgi:hypothetical protein
MYLYELFAYSTTIRTNATEAPRQPCCYFTSYKKVIPQEICIFFEDLLPHTVLGPHVESRAIFAPKGQVSTVAMLILLMLVN